MQEDHLEDLEDLEDLADLLRLQQASDFWSVDGVRQTQYTTKHLCWRSSGVVTAEEIKQRVV